MNSAIRILTDKSLVGIMPPENEDYIIKTISPEADCAETVETLAVSQPDIAFLNMFMPHRDAIDVVNSYISLFAYSRPCFVIAGSYMSEQLEREIISCGALPITLSAGLPSRSAAAVRDVVCQKTHERMHEQNAGIFIAHRIHGGCSSASLEDTVSEVLHALGVNESIVGYDYLKRAVMMATIDGSVVSSVTNVVYPSIAVEFGTTPSTVERRIRRAISTAWEDSESNVLEAYFGHTVDINRGKPANSEFIAMIADRIRLSLSVIA